MASKQAELLLTDTGKVRFHGLQGARRNIFAPFTGKPRGGEVVALAIVTAFYTVAQRHDVGSVSASTCVKWYPVIGGKYAGFIAMCSANGAGMLPVSKAKVPVGLCELIARVFDFHFTGSIAKAYFGAMSLAVLLARHVAFDSILPVRFPVRFLEFLRLFLAVCSLPFHDALVIFRSVRGGFLQRDLAVGKVIIAVAFVVAFKIIKVGFALLFFDDFGNFFAAFTHRFTGGCAFAVSAARAIAAKILDGLDIFALGALFGFHAYIVPQVHWISHE